MRPRRPGRAGYFGPPGTNTEEALRAHAPADVEAVPFATIHDVVVAVHEGQVERAMVPIENSLEGSVNATLDSLFMETEDVVIAGEAILPIHHCLIARDELALADVRAVVSHPHANAQCARFLRDELPQATVLGAPSTADAVRAVAESAEPGQAAIGNRLSAELYGCRILRADIEDEPDNETRFVWLARRDAPVPDAEGPWKTSIVFWGAGDRGPGWLMGCLSEFADRAVDLTRIESRPRRIGLGRYRFFLDVEGREDDEPVRAALAALRERCEGVRTLGSYPAAG